MTKSNNPGPGFARNPDKKITVAPHPGIVSVRSGDTIIASSKKALVLAETPYAPVYYLPFDDVNFDMLEKTATTSHCPYKGDASYWSIKGGATDAMWAYERPYDEVRQIRAHGAFYRDRVTVVDA